MLLVVWGLLVSVECASRRQFTSWVHAFKDYGSKIVDGSTCFGHCILSLLLYKDDMRMGGLFKWKEIRGFNVPLLKGTL